MSKTKNLWVGVCTCANSDNLARQRLKNGKYEHWMTFPIHRGKNDCLVSLEKFKNDGYAVEPIAKYIKERGSFVLFALLLDDDGTKTIHYVDANISLGDRLTAEAYVEVFAKK